MKKPGRMELTLKLKGSTPEETADFYGVSRATMYRWIKKFEIPYNSRTGCKHYKCNLSHEQVMKIYDAKGKALCKELAGLYEVSESTICNIWNMKTHREEIFKELQLRNAEVHTTYG